MRAGSPIRAYEAMRGWWVTAVRVLSLVLALALLAPGAIDPADARRLDSHELLLSAPSDGTSTSQPDGCSACHANCGCHQVISPEGSAWAPGAETTRPSYASADVAVVTVTPDRHPRPPRA